MPNEMFTQLPVASTAFMSDILCSVQGYVSPTQLGISTQQTLQQVYNLFTSAGGLPGVNWNTITGSSANLLSNNGYFINSSGVVSLPLPTVAAVGSTITVLEVGSGSFTITQGAGQQITIAPIQTTLGVAGSLTSAIPFASLTLVCVVANTIWQAPVGVQGEFTYV